jgi:hypothetical protein
MEEKEPKVVVYKDIHPRTWIWEVFDVNDKIQYSGTEETFSLAYEVAKKTRAKHHRKLSKKEDSSSER